MNNKKLKISLIQMQGRGSVLENSILIKKNLKKTLKYKSHMIFTPECSNIITGNKDHLINNITNQSNCPVLFECKKFAKKYNKFISIGSLLLKKNNSNKLLNRSFLINNLGKIISFYDKIHLFDAKINKNEIHHESKTFIKGKNISICNSPWGKIGLTICYDLRFPILYKQLVKLGCKIILVPAAFTIPTGKSHWKILLRSRAIENTCFIIATAQCGQHHGFRNTYGHSLVVDPWGKVIIEGSKKPGIFSTTIDLNSVNLIRSKLPSIYHD